LSEPVDASAARCNRGLPDDKGGRSEPVHCCLVTLPGMPRAGDDGVTRRLKALACTAPLHDLDARKSRVDWADAARYQMAEIGLQAID